jgi:chemotaxis protein MotA
LPIRLNFEVPSEVSSRGAGLGIVAAVLGVVITMGALGGPPQEIGRKVAAALVALSSAF